MSHRADLDAALRSVPEGTVVEVLDGQAFTSPRPPVLQRNAASNLGVLLGGPFRFGQGGPGGWVFLDEPAVHLGPRPDRVVPDLAGWRRERMREVVDDHAVTLAPDWVCEVVSPRTARLDRGPKLRLYAREGVGHVWLVDPVAQTLEVLRQESGRWILIEVRGDETDARVEPFGAVALDVSRLWAR